LRIKDVEGDIVECGIGFGHTLLMNVYLTHVENKKRYIYGFDSFKDFPEPTEEDESIRNPKKGEWKVITEADLDDIIFRRCQLPVEARSRLKITKGYFDESLPKTKIEKIALLHLDVDLYDSYKTCLNNLYSKVVKNGVILFDEYKQGDTQEVFPGAAKAIDEFFEDKNEEILYDANFDKYYLIKS